MLASTDSLHTIPVVTMNRLLTSLLLLLSLAASAAPSLAPIFTDGMVLQQGRSVPVWGHAEPGEHILVSFRGQQVGATADTEGKWQVLLTPLTASGEETELSIQGSTTLTLRRILVGDVWLCIGQNALQSPLSQAAYSSSQVPPASMPLLRLFNAIPPPNAGDNPPVPSTWTVAGALSNADISAEAFLFGCHLLRKTGVPIGIIQVAPQNGRLRSWLSPAAFATTPELNFVQRHWQEEQALFPTKTQAYLKELAAWKKAEKKAKDSSPVKLASFYQRRHPPEEPQLQEPFIHFSKLLAPLFPSALKGIVLHDGSTPHEKSTEYEAILRSFITASREHFGTQDLPVILVQLGPQRDQASSNEENWALLRHAQNSVLSLPYTSMITSLDLGDAKAVHPYTALEIARRLGQTALGVIYNIDVEYAGPSVSTSRIDQGKLCLTFEHADTGLISYKKPVQSLELAGPDGRYFPATAIIQGPSLIISCPEVTKPQAVRYAWNKAPFANLANGAGIPAPPFYFLIQGTDTAPQ